VVSHLRFTEGESGTRDLPWEGGCASLRGRVPRAPLGLPPVPSGREWPPRGSPEAPKRAFSGVPPREAEKGQFWPFLAQNPHFGGFWPPGTQRPLPDPRGTAGAPPGVPEGTPPLEEGMGVEPPPVICTGGGADRRGSARVSPQGCSVCNGKQDKRGVCLLGFWF